MTITYEEACSFSKDFRRVQDSPLACGLWSDSDLLDCRIIYGSSDAEFPLLEHDIQENLECYSLSGSSNTTCQQNCASASAASCNGSSSYCALRLNASLTPCSSSDCFCAVTNSSSKFTLKDKFGNYLISSSSVDMIPTFQEFDLSKTNFCGDKTYKISLSSDGEVLVTTNQTGNYHCKIHKNSIYDFLFTSGLNYSVPHYNMLKTSNITVQCYCSNKVVKTSTRLLLAASNCGYHKFWTKGWFLNIYCWNFSDWFYTILIISTCIAIYALLKKLYSKYPKIKALVTIITIPYYMLKWFVCYIKDTGKIPVIELIMRKFKSLVMTASYWFTPKRKKDDIESQPDTPISYTSNGDEKEKESDFNRILTQAANSIRGKVVYKKGAPVSAYPLAILCIISVLFVPQVQSICYSSSVITGNLTNCVDSNGTSSCSVMFSSLVNIPNKYSNSCIDIVDSDKNHIMRLEISATVFQKIALQSVYYTCPWDFQMFLNNRCNGETWFTHDVTCPNDGCLSVEPDDPTVTVSLPVSGKRDRQLDTPHDKYPGYSGCLRSNPGGCPLGPYSCSYFRYVLKPHDDYSHVMKMFSTSTEISINIDITNFLANFPIPVYKVGPYYYVGPDRKTRISLLGSYDTHSSFVQDKFVVVQSNGKVSLNNANPSGVPGANIGDYQAGSYADLYKIGKPYFDKGNFKLSDDGSNGISVQYQKSTYYANVNLGTPFPLTQDGNIYHFSNGYLQTELNDPPTVAMMLETVLPINVVYKKTDVNPECSFKSASGTSNSAQGSVIIIECKSSIDSGIVSLTTDSSYTNLLTKSLMLSQSFEPYSIQVQTSVVVNSFYLIIQGTSNSQKILIKFDAYEPSNTPNTTNSQGQAYVKDGSNETPYHDFGDDFLDGFTFGSIKNALMTWGIILAIVLSILFVTCLVVRRFIMP